MHFFRLACFLTAISIISSNAQTSAPGYIVTLKNDTVRGYLSDRIDAQLSEKVEFFKEQGGTSTGYLPSGLKGFGFNSGRVFKRVPYAEKGADTLYVFAKRVVQGRIDMYVRRKLTRDQADVFLYNNELRRHVYIWSPSREFVEGADGKKYVPNENQHLALLSYVTNGAAAAELDKRGTRYSEAGVTRKIVAFNIEGVKRFPLKEYKEAKEFAYEITAGLPLNDREEGARFRAAVYRTKTNPERSGTVSFIRGISYHYWKSAEGPLAYYQQDNSSLNYQMQRLSIIPIGFNLHAAKGIVRLYAYGGLGLTAFVYSNYRIVDHINRGTEIEFMAFPTLNVGVGLKFKVGSKFILAEVTPDAIDKVLLFNLGFAF